MNKFYKVSAYIIFAIFWMFASYNGISKNYEHYNLLDWVIIVCVVVAPYLPILFHMIKKARKRARRLSNDTPLPVVKPGINLKLGEMCHYCNKVILAKSKNAVVGYSGSSSGFRFRIAKGISYHTGTSRSVPIRGRITEKTKGKLSITNERLVFSSIDKAFDKKISNLSNVVSYKNAIMLQFGSDQYLLYTDEAIYIYQIINRIRK